MEKWKPKNEWPLWVQLMFNTKVTLHCQYVKCSFCTKLLIQVNSFRNLNQITWLEPLLLRPFEFEQRLEAKQLAAQPTADPSCTIQTSEGNLLHAQSIEYFQTQKKYKNDPSYKRDLLTQMRKKWSNPPFSSIKSIKSLPVISTGWDKLRLSAVLLSVALLVKVLPPGRDDQPSGTNLGQYQQQPCGKSRLKHKCAFNPWLLPTWKYVELLSIFRWNHVKSTTKSPGQTNQNSDRVFAAGHYSSCIPPSLQCGDTIEFCLKLF